MEELFDENKIDKPDEVYDCLIAAHEGLSLDESRQLNSRLILLLTNAVGNSEVVKKIIEKARESLQVR